MLVGAARDAAAQATLFGLAHQGSRGQSTLHKLDPESGMVIETIGNGVGFAACSGMDADRFGTMYATCIKTPIEGRTVLVLVTIDLETGIATEEGRTFVEDLEFEIMETEVIRQAADLSFRNSDGILYAYFKIRDAVGIIDLSSGAADLLPPGEPPPEGGDLRGLAGVDGRGNGMAFSPKGRLVHSQQRNIDSRNALNILDQVTGFPTEVGPGLAFNFPADLAFINAMDFHPETGGLYASLVIDPEGENKNNLLVTVDPETGAVDMMGPTVAGLDAIAWLPGEPGEMAGPLSFSHFRIKQGKFNFSLRSSVDDSIEIKGRFTLDPDSNGVDPQYEEVKFTVGGTAVVIPPGSFAPNGSGWRFDGLINGASVRAKIKERQTDKFKFKIKARGLNLAGMENPANIQLRIGDDAGSVLMKLRGKLRGKDHGKDRDKDRDKDKDKDDD